MRIYWYENDARFMPGTVSDVGKSFRLTLSSAGKSSYRLLLQVRTHKKDGVIDALKFGVVVARFKDCADLKDAQKKAEEWLESFVSSIIAATY